MTSHFNDVTSPSEAGPGGSLLSPLEALAAVHTYFNTDGSSSWCYALDTHPDTALLLPPGWEGDNTRRAAAYQACTEGVLVDSLLPVAHAGGSLFPSTLTATAEEFGRQCR